MIKQDRLMIIPLNNILGDRFLDTLTFLYSAFYVCLLFAMMFLVVDLMSLKLHVQLLLLHCNISFIHFGQN